MRARDAVLLFAATASGCAAGSTERPPSKAPKNGPASVVIVDHGKARAVIHVPAAIMEPNGPPSPAERDRRRLRDSVTDLAETLERISGAPIPLSTDADTSADRLPILIGAFAEARFGKATSSDEAGQGYRAIVSEAGIGFEGQSALGVSYAIYELLDRLGCRWLMPGPLGEALPKSATIAIAPFEIDRAPSTLFRDVWFEDEAYRRRNRAGGFLPAAGHGLEGWVSASDRQKHPEWRGIVNGSPSPRRLDWSNPEVAAAVARGVTAVIDQSGERSMSLSPDDGADFSDTPNERALDVPVTNSQMGVTSLTDRLYFLVNGVARDVAKTHPDALLGLYAYVQFTQPPVREKVPTNVVPVIAPIVYCRAHPFTDDGCPGSKELRDAIAGWTAASKRVGYYAYGYHLAEPSAPYPMLAKWSAEVPFVLAHGVRYWQPETLPTFENNAIALWLGLRLAFDRNTNPNTLIDDAISHFYGSAGPSVRRYLTLVDDAWTTTPAHAGAEHGHLRRFPEPTLAAFRRALDEATAACRTEDESARVALLDASLRQLELYMTMRRAWARGAFADLDVLALRWRNRATELAEAHRADFAFGGTPYAPEGMYVRYFDTYVATSYAEAARFAQTNRVLGEPIGFAFHPAESSENWALPSVDDGAWQKTNPATESWSDLGLHAYFGDVWYRAHVRIAARADGKHTYLWLGGATGTIHLWVNGRDVRGAEANLGPVTFELPDDAIGDVVIAIRATRKNLDELGVGGLTGPAVLVRGE